MAPPNADENTPLLPSASVIQSQAPEPIANPSKDNNGGVLSPTAEDANEDDDKPLPKLQIFLLCFARLIEPMAFFGIFPFVNKMIEETGGLEEADVGFYSGLIESMFSLTQMFVMIWWGRAADRIGRKPILVFSLGGVAVATALFGFSKMVWQMIFFRMCAGLFAGTVVTIRTMITENSTPRTTARAFSFFAFSGNLGIFVGPLLGGFLQDPAAQYPNLFGSFTFFREFPYALPTVANGLFAVSAAIACGLFVKETLERNPASGSEAPSPPMSTWEVINSPGVPTVLFLYSHVMLLGIAYTAISPLFWFTEVSLGGFGFSPMLISAFICSAGVAQAFWLLVIFPPLQHAIGTGGTLRACLYAWPLFFICSPLCNWFLRNGWTVAFWTIAPLAQTLGCGVAMAFTGVQLALNDISPSHQTLGTINAVALTLTSGIRAVGPVLITSIFALGAHTQILNGYLVWVVLIAVALLGSVSVRYLPEIAEGRPKNKAQRLDA
ncbi:major facilitator superfamily domain-containing protein [Amylocarpus encephaloides]|uniref:Major facilitator superfamily domain-containing protein n=1 Tax=Amylocarpus encephaloides TaxID=45428 RepID=A0A9P7YBU8_9HELO|nr:major facilitator superfamily domain-containing protein [Amylocarpus encephaloides]